MRVPVSVVALLLLLAAALPAGAQENPPTPDTAARAALSLRAQRVTTPIRVDGELDDAAWQTAQRATGFTEFQPREGAAPPGETEAMVAYDDRYLYVAFIAHGDPAEIRATWRNRDQIWDDDVVGVILDPFGNASLAYLLVANPYGIQGDLLRTYQQEDDSWDAVFESAGRITATGYQVEMAIPLRSLRFPDREVQNWTINFYRNMPRANRHQISWAPLSRDNPCMVCQSAPLLGLEGIRPGGGVELLPAFVASSAGTLGSPEDPASFRQGDPTGSFSLGAKYAFGGWTVESTLNPDFSQVESDAAQIDVNTTFALSFPERRPFFQEGSDLYDTEVDVFYSRSINAPRAAAKLTRRTGNTSIGYITAYDQDSPYILPFEERSAFVRGGASYSNVFRVRQNLEGGSHFGALLTDRRPTIGGSGSNASVDALLRFRRIYSLQAQLVASYTREPDAPELTEGLPDIRFGRGAEQYTAAFDGERFAGRALAVELDRTARTWGFDVEYEEATPTYRAENGYQSRNDFRRVSGGTRLSFYPGRYGVERVTPSIGGGRIWNFGGEGKDVWLRPGLSLLLPRQTNVSVNGLVSRERFRDVEFDMGRASINFNTVPSERVAFGFSAQYGQSIARTLATPALGLGTDAEVWATLKPTNRLVLRPAAIFFRLDDDATGDELYSGYIARLRADYQFSRELSLRVITEYNDFGDGLDVEPLLVYRLNPFSIFYVGSTQVYRAFDGVGWRGSDRQYFLKFQYLFQL